MSAFAGCYRFDGGPVDREQICAMGQALELRAPDGGDDQCRGSMGMSYRAFHTTRESRWESQPMEGPRGELLCWDGRLDNREELQLQLRCPVLPSDAELVMAAYEKWGEDFLAHLVGDFALAMFDPHERRVLLGRDFFGPRPLYYCLHAERLLWSTDLLPLLRSGGMDPALDDEYIAQFLVLSIEPRRSPYRNIRAVEPGRVMIFHEGRITKNDWHWKPDPANEIRRASDGEYEEEFYALVRQAVKARLRADGAVWGDLSGGLDSSSIVSMADEILRQDRVDCPRLDTWTAVNGESILTNELPYARLVEEKRGVAGHHLREDALWFRNILSGEYQQASPNVSLCAPERTARLNLEMNRAGARVRLSGHAGDHLLASSGVSAEPADLLRGFQFAQLDEHLRIWSRSTGQPYLKTLIKDAALPALPDFLRECMEGNAYLLRSLPASFRRRFSRSTFSMCPRDPFGYSRPSSRERVRSLLAAIRITAGGMTPQFATFEVRYPYLDRRLVEWLLAIPPFQIQRPGETRSLMRRAFRRLLPAPIWERRTKGTLDEAVCRGLNAAWSDIEELFSNSRLARSGYFDAGYLRQAAQSVAHGGSMTRVVFARLVALELWLRAIEDRGLWRLPAAGGRKGTQTEARIPRVSFAKD